MGTTGFRSYVALGDSFTEGMDDPRDDGTFRGWADLVAHRLAERADGFRYANLAIRGRLLEPVIAEQVPVAVQMAPDLISIAAGGNDALRRRFDIGRLSAVYDEAIGRLVATGATVVVFTPADPTGHLPARSSLVPRCELLLAAVRRVAAERGAVLVDLWSDDVLRDRRMWSEDRLHLSAVGHRRVAAHVLEALGVEPVPQWRDVLPASVRVPWVSARREDVRWVRSHLVPWVGRRVRGRSSGDTITAKRPTLDPLVPDGAR